MAEVKIYTTPTCPYCKMAKKFFQDNKVAYQELNVAEDKKALDEMLKRSKQMSVPVIDIDGEIITGFNMPQIKQKLGLA
jgi:glutaredoxin 3